MNRALTGHTPTRIRRSLLVVLLAALAILGYFLTRPIFSDGAEEIFPESTALAPDS